MANISQRFGSFLAASALASAAVPLVAASLCGATAAAAAEPAAEVFGIEQGARQKMASGILEERARDAENVAYQIRRSSGAERMALIEAFAMRQAARAEALESMRPVLPSNHEEIDAPAQLPAESITTVEAAVAERDALDESLELLQIRTASLPPRERLQAISDWVAANESRREAIRQVFEKQYAAPKGEAPSVFDPANPGRLNPEIEKARDSKNALLDDLEARMEASYDLTPEQRTDILLQWQTNLFPESGAPDAKDSTRQ